MYVKEHKEIKDLPRLVDKLQDEYDELKGKCDRLSEFIDGDRFKKLHYKMQQLLKEQYKYMIGYRRILLERINFIRNNY